MNRVCLVGRLTKDPTCEYVNTSNGSVARARFTVAVNRPFGSRDDSGNNSKADFISVVAWRNQAENLSKYQKKGNQISVEGRLQVDNYTDKNGNQVWNTYVLADNIQFLDKKEMFLILISVMMMHQVISLQIHQVLLVMEQVFGMEVLV